MMRGAGIPVRKVVATAIGYRDGIPFAFQRLECGHLVRQRYPSSRGEAIAALFAGEFWPTRRRCIDCARGDNSRTDYICRYYDFSVTQQEATR